MSRVFLIDGVVALGASPFLSQPIGLLSIAAVLRQAGHEVAVHDCKLDIQSLGRRLTRFAPDVVGIRTLSSFTHILDRVARTVHGLFPHVPIVVGGPHANALPADAITRGQARCAVLGEGEMTFLELLEPLLAGEDLATIAGIAYVDDAGEVVETPPRPPIADLDTLPMPAYDLVPMELYFSLHHGGTAPSGRSATLFTSRGCPYRCSFCHNLFGTRYRTRSADAVLDEMFYLHRRYGVEELEIHDDAFNMDLRRLAAICDGLQRAGSPMLISFPNGLRGDRLPREALEQLAAAGTHHLALSPETATPRLHDLLGKRMDLDKLHQAALDCDDLGILTLGYFMLGFPTETEAELQATIDWACKSPLHTASFFNVVAFPGTPLHDLALAHGKDPSGWMQAQYTSGLVNFSTVDDRRFQAIFQSAYRRFYLSPRRIRAIWRATPHKGVLLRNGLFVAARMLAG